MPKQCPRCNEAVDAAKAFCPGCGHAFEDEQAPEHISGFDQMDSTVQLGQTMYNQMLSDMQLNISKAPDAKRTIDLVPAAEAPRPDRPAAAEPAPPAANKSWLWWVLGGFFAALVLIVFVIIAILLVLYRFS